MKEAKLKKPEKRQVCKTVWGCNIQGHNHTTKHIAQKCIDKHTSSFCRGDLISKSKARELEAFRLRHECNKTYKDIGITVGRLHDQSTPISGINAKRLINNAERRLRSDPSLYGHEYFKYLSSAAILEAKINLDSYIKSAGKKIIILAAEVADLPIDSLSLSNRTKNCLSSEGILKISDLADKKRSDLFKIPNFGKKSYNEIRDVLFDVGAGDFVRGAWGWHT